MEATIPFSEDLQVFDRDTALARIGGDDELLGEVAQLYLLEYPGLVQEIADSIGSASMKTLRGSAHKLKGSLGLLGAERAASAALALETLGRNETIEGAEQGLQVLLAELEAFHAALRESLGGAAS